MRHSQLVVAVGLLVALVGPGTSGSFAVPTLSRDALRNTVYRSVYVGSGEVKLVNGKAEVDDPEGKVTVSLTDFVAFGDLNGDGLSDAVAVLVTHGGGTGSFYDLAAVIDRRGKAVHAASAPLGDRVKVESVGITAGQVEVRMVTHAREDPLCCPTLPVRKTYRLQGSQLVEQTATQRK